MSKKVYWFIGLLVMLTVGCEAMGSGYTAEQIAAIQQGTPVSVALTAFPVTYAPTRLAPASVGIGGESAAVQAQMTIDASTRIAGEATYQSDEATRIAGVATQESIRQTADAAVLEQQIAAANIDLSTQAQLASLQVTLATEQISVTIQAMSDQAMIDAADVRSAEQQLYWFEQVQRAEAEKALSQARFWQLAQYVLLVIAIVLIGAGLYWWFVMRPHQQVRVVAVNGKEMALVQTPNGYAPIVQARQQWEPERPVEPEPSAESVPSTVTLPRLVELPEVKPDILQVGMFETGAPIHLGMGFKGILVTGEPGSGKSTFLRQLVAQALQHGWLIYLADGEQITFQPHLWGPVAKTHAEVVEWLGWLKGDIVEARHDLFRRVSEEIENRLPPAQQFLVEDLPGYNRAAAMFGMPSMSPMIIGWDEANKTLGDKNVQVLFDDLAQSARKVGAEMIVSGHDWRAAQVPKGSSSYLPWRVAFRSEKTSSEVVLRGSAAAMRIPFDRKGLAYTIMREWRGYTQGYFVPDARLIQMIRQMRPRRELPEATPWSGYTVTHHRPTALPAEASMNDLITESQAEADADLLLSKYNEAGGYRSRRQVALHLAGNDDPDGYDRGDEALKILRRRGAEWAAKLLTTDARYTA